MTLTPGRRFYIAGSLGLVLFATGHTLGALHTFKLARTDTRLASALKSLDEYSISFPGLDTTLLQIRNYFEFAFSAFLLIVAALNLIALRLAGDARQSTRVMSAFNVGGMAILLALSIYFRILPGIVSCATIGVLFMIAWFRARPE
ncbi:MAG: LIC_13387 family protein [Tepidisphaeraceae bacterium]